MSEKIQDLGKEFWERKLSEIGTKLKLTTVLTVIGSVPNIMNGQTGRTSIDLDVWRKSSKFDAQDLRRAVEASGLLFNPTEELEPNTPYVQIVDQGIVQVGKFNKLEKLLTQGKLTIACPPVENLIASKLVRSDERDLEDIAYLLGRFKPSTGKVKEIVSSFPPSIQVLTKENLVYLEVLSHAKDIDLE